MVPHLRVGLIRARQGELRAGARDAGQTCSQGVDAFSERLGERGELIARCAQTESVGRRESPALEQSPVLRDGPLGDDQAPSRVTLRVARACWNDFARTRKAAVEELREGDVPRDGGDPLGVDVGVRLVEVVHGEAQHVDGGWRRVDPPGAREDVVDGYRCDARDAVVAVLAARGRRESDRRLVIRGADLAHASEHGDFVLQAAEGIREVEPHGRIPHRSGAHMRRDIAKSGDGGLPELRAHAVAPGDEEHAIVGVFVGARITHQGREEGRGRRGDSRAEAAEEASTRGAKRRRRRQRMGHGVSPETRVDSIAASWTRRSRMGTSSSKAWIKRWS